MSLLRLAGLLCLLAISHACDEEYLTSHHHAGHAHHRHLTQAARREVEPETSFSYVNSALDWNTTGWSCLNGTMQSPINLPTNVAAGQLRVTPDVATQFVFGARTGVVVINNGRTIQVEWASAQADNFTLALRGDSLFGFFNATTGAVSSASTATVTAAAPAAPRTAFGATSAGAPAAAPATSTAATNATGSALRMVPLWPRQFHFHSPSEHTVAGRQYPLEAHLVSRLNQTYLPACPAAGCIVVTAVLFQFGDDVTEDNAFLAGLLDEVPHKPELIPKSDNYTLNLTALIPQDRSYYTYQGSLTTPPCSESVLFHVFQQPLTVSVKQVADIQNALAAITSTCSATQLTALQAARAAANVSTASLTIDPSLCVSEGTRGNNRFPQPLNGRSVRYFTAQ